MVLLHWFHWGCPQYKGCDPVACTAHVGWSMLYDLNGISPILSGFIDGFWDGNIPSAIGRKSTVPDFHRSDFLCVCRHRVLEADHYYLLTIIDRWIMPAYRGGYAGWACTEQQDASGTDQGKLFHRLFMGFIATIYYIFECRYIPFPIFLLKPQKLFGAGASRQKRMGCLWK